MVFDDLNNASLAEEGWSVLDDDYFGLEAKNTQEGDFLIELTVHCTLYTRDLGVESVFLVIFEILVDLQLSREEIGLKLIEMRNIPTHVFLKCTVSEEVILRNDSNKLSEF